FIPLKMGKIRPLLTDEDEIRKIYASHHELDFLNASFHTYTVSAVFVSLYLEWLNYWPRDIC
ncbi:MAG: hypothetical protein WA144_15870, partial [Candidatus Methanoperedens sp.]